MNNRLINTKVAGGGGGCTDIVDNYDPFGGNGLALYQLNGNANDVSTNYNGAWVGTAAYTTGIFGQSANLSGNNYITMSGLASFFTPKQTFTVSLWFKTSGSNVSRYLFSDEVFSFTNNYNITISQGASGILNVYTVYGGVVSNYATTATYKDNAWHNIVVTIDQSNQTGTVYIDGAFSGSYTLSTGTKTGTPYPVIGTVGNAYLPFIGQIDQVRIFNTALTPLEVEALYTEELCICDGTVDTLQVLGDTSCIATYQLDGNSNDLSGNYSGTPTDVSYGVGEFDLAGVFNGSSSYIDTNFTVPAISTYSASVWLKTTSTARQIIFSDYNSAGTGTSTRLSLGISAASKFEFVIGNGSDNWSDTTSVDASAYLDGNWHNLVLVISGTSVKLYADGNTTPIGDLTSAISAGTLGTQSVKLCRAGDFNGLYFNGSIDQVRIFNKALNSSEVTTLYNETACTKAACSGTTNTLDILSDGSCIATYPLDGSPADLSGNYNGVQSGGLTYPQGEFDLAGSFWLNEITLPQGTMPSGNDERSVSAWIKTTYYAHPYQQIVTYGGDGTNLGFYFRTGYLGNPTLGVAFYANDFDVDASSTNLFNGEWHHVVCTVGTTIARLYVDGNQLGGDYSKGTINTTNTEVKISSTNSSLSFKGEIDQVRIFNKALSAGEVTTLYNETPCN